MPSTFLRTERDEELLIWWLDQEGDRHNKITMEALAEMEQSLGEVEADPEIRGIVVISAKSDSFIVGADVRMLQGFRSRSDAEELSRRAHSLIARVRSLGKPVVAAIHGPAMGGGLELALACTARIASDHPATKFALPEVRLGLLPGGGGTQLLPRLVGITRALPILLTGKNVYPRPARRMGLVDALIHRPGLLSAGKQMARELIAGRREASPSQRSLLESNPLTRKLIYAGAEKQVWKETRGNYPAPTRIIECVRTGIENGLDEGFLTEERHFGDLAVTPESVELVRLFFAKGEAEKNPYEGGRDVRLLGILGAGLMGSGIAQVSAENGIDVVVKDRSLELASKAREQVFRESTSRVRKTAIRPFDRDRIFERVTATGDYTPFRNVQMVIEAAPEDVTLKQELIREVERHVKPETVFASNTSSIPIGRLAEASARAELIIGMHYFSPVPRMPLLEIIRMESTPEWVLATAVDVGLAQGKTIIVVNDGPGFYTTRILAVYMNEALLLLKDGAKIEQVDEAMRDFGFPMGPFELFDLVGIDVATKITDVLSEFFSSRGLVPSLAAHALVERGLKGQKTQAGFYRYEGDSRRPAKKGVNEAAYEAVGKGKDIEQDIGQDVAQERLSLAMINEAVKCLDEGILRSAQDGDVGAVFGLGFPPFRGGPFRYIDARGAKDVYERLLFLNEKLGERFRPAALLQKHAASGKAFT